MRYEIGSEFCSANLEKVRLENKNNELFLLSGRTCIDYIIKDILAIKKVSKVILPSYLCESMIEPFIRNKIEIDYYDVDNENIYYKENDADVILLIDYFGYINKQNIEIARKEKGKKVIIYDSTHNINCNFDMADYLFCSFRKWFFSNCCYLKKNNSSFNIDLPKNSNRKYIELRNDATFLKRQYLEEKISTKQFLNEFRKAEELIDKDYQNYIGEFYNIDFNKLITRRCNNAKYLINELRKIKEVKLWKNTIDENDVPLFVPIIVNKNQRDNLVRHLIDKKIYCPVHWPYSIYHSKYNDLYEKEISIICDQRYTIEDMKYICDCIKEFFERRT